MKTILMTILSATMLMSCASHKCGCDKPKSECTSKSCKLNKDKKKKCGCGKSYKKCSGKSCKLDKKGKKSCCSKKKGDKKKSEGDDKYWD